MRNLVPVFCLAGALLQGCTCGSKDTQPTSSAPTPEPSASASAVASAAPRTREPAPTRQGSVISRSALDDVLFIAEEDRSSIRVVPLPIGPNIGAVTALPGRPAQVIALDGKLLVTIRDPGLLLAFRIEADNKLVEAGRVELPADAWGLAITPDEKTALVTSAWTHKVSSIDLDAMKVRFTLDVAREPRGVVITADGSRAYINHLIGSNLTRIEGITSDNGSARPVALPASPLRANYTDSFEASLGYSLTLSPDGKRLYAARHALGAPGPNSWFGAATVDVLLTRDDSALAPIRKPPAVYGQVPSDPMAEDLQLFSVPNGWTQPRAMVFRKKNSTLLVAAEASASVMELDAVSIDPSATPLHRYKLFTEEKKGPPPCGAPSGIALSKDELIAWVYCRSTGSVAALDFRATSIQQPIGLSVVTLGEQPGDARLEEGRRLFYSGTDEMMSEGLACSGCHPEGRDDGHVWLQVEGPFGNDVFVGGSLRDDYGYPRQTPMLAGRLRAAGPYGWHSQNADLKERVLEGFSLHRWFNWDPSPEATKKASILATFARSGLVPPPRALQGAELTPDEKKGKAIFMSEATQCTKCHMGDEYTDRVAVPLRPREEPKTDEKTERNRPPRREDANKNFKTPSLLFAGGTPPYFHDGSAATLEDLIEKNDDRMGKTNQLSKEEKAALVAFLRTL